MQYTYATSAYHEVGFSVHFHLAIRVNFERGGFSKNQFERSVHILRSPCIDQDKTVCSLHLSIQPNTLNWICTSNRSHHTIWDLEMGNTHIYHNQNSELQLGFDVHSKWNLNRSFHIS